MHYVGISEGYMQYICIIDGCEGTRFRDYRAKVQYSAKWR